MRVWFWLAWLLVVGAGPAWAQPDPNLKRCVNSTFIDNATGGPVVITSRPAIVCSVECLATAANSRVDLWDSPNGLSSHGQARTVLEVGAATAGNSAVTGQINRLTHYGLTVENASCDVSISWDD